VLLPLALAWALAAAGHAVEPPAPCANLLLDVSCAFVHAAVQKTIDQTDPLYDVILGAQIQGTGRTRGQVRAELIPDSGCAVVELVATGVTHAQSVATRGPVHMTGVGTVPFQVRQRLLLDAAGVHSGPPQLRLTIHSVPTGMTTDFQGVLLDRIVKRVGWRVYQRNKEEGMRIAVCHAKQKLREKVDEAAQPQLELLQKAYVEGLQKLAAKGIALAQLHFSTTTDNLSLAAVAQTAAAGPPAAPPPVKENPDLALRLHETLANHLAQFHLHGKTYNSAQLEKQAPKFLGPLGSLAEGTPSKPWSITFVEGKPLTITFADGGFRVETRLAEFTSGEDVFPGMNVSARFRFQCTPRGVVAQRQGEVEAFPLDFDPKGGQKLSARQQAMRTILQRRFSKLFQQELLLDNLALPQGLSKVGPLVVSRADAANGWLLLTWRRGEREASAP
jgi:hypothetical protein